MAGRKSSPRVLDVRLPEHRAVLEAHSSFYAPVSDALYINSRARPEIHAAELLPFLAPGGRLSWRWVLGEGPVYSSMPGAFYVVEPDGGTREVQTMLGRFDIRGMPGAIFHAGADEDSIDPCFDPFRRFSCATAERAICDWIYFAMHEKGYGENGWGLGPAPDQTDLDGLSIPRIERLADAMDIRANFDRWYARWQEVQRDDEATEKFSRALRY